MILRRRPGLVEGKSEDAISTRLEQEMKATQGGGRRKCGNLRHGQDRGDCPEQKKDRPGRRPRHYDWVNTVYFNEQAARPDVRVSKKARNA